MSSTALLGDGKNLRNLAGHAENTSTGLQVAKCLHIEDALGEERSSGGGKQRNEERSHGGAVAVVEDQNSDDNVLGHDEGRLAVGVKGEAIAVVVGQSDDVGAGLQEVGEEGDTIGGLRADQLQDLRDLDDGGSSNDADAQTLADAILDALGIFDVDVEQEGLVALFADDGCAEVANRTGEVMGDGLEDRSYGVHCESVCGASVVGREKKID